MKMHPPGCNQLSKLVHLYCRGMSKNFDSVLEEEEEEGGGGLTVDQFEVKS